MRFPITHKPEASDLERAAADRAEVTPTPDTADPNVLPPELALREAVPLLSHLAKDHDFLNSRVLPLLEESGRVEDQYVAHRDDFPDGSSLQVFFWPPGSRTRIHDHASWGAFCRVAGSLFEERYALLDKGLKPNHASLRRLWRETWKEGDGVSTVLPYDGGIHRVGNPTHEPAISVHLYGPRMAEIDGRDYDPSRDHVCDRPEAV
jgi:predicted metal-dependent enzyme (double-stranded beta helix superfamily)